MEHIVVGKVKFSPSNLRGSLIFNLKLQNWVKKHPPIMKTK